MSIKDCLIMKLYHGSDKELSILATSSYVSKTIKEAEKFAYRRAIMGKSPYIYIYELEIDAKFLQPDPKRNRAFITLQEVELTQVKMLFTYSASYKLKKFNP